MGLQQTVSKTAFLAIARRVETCANKLGLTKYGTSSGTVPSGSSATASAPSAPAAQSTAAPAATAAAGMAAATATSAAAGTTALTYVQVLSVANALCDYLSANEDSFHSRDFCTTLFDVAWVPATFGIPGSVLTKQVITK